MMDQEETDAAEIVIFQFLTTLLLFDDARIKYCAACSPFYSHFIIRTVLYLHVFFFKSSHPDPNESHISAKKAVGVSGNSFARDIKLFA